MVTIVKKAFCRNGEYYISILSVLQCLHTLVVRVKRFKRGNIFPPRAHITQGWVSYLTLKLENINLRSLKKYLWWKISELLCLVVYGKNVYESPLDHSLFIITHHYSLSSRITHDHSSLTITHYYSPLLVIIHHHPITIITHQYSPVQFPTHR